MKTCKIRDIRLGEGVPKICVPIVETSDLQIKKAAIRIAKEQVDMVEWRVDWYEDVLCLNKVENMLLELRMILGDVPLLFTFRTKREGGQKDILPEQYRTLNLAAAKSSTVDMIDVEVFGDELFAKNLIEELHSYSVKVVGSNHDFEKTPEKEEIIRRLCTMQQMGADIPKIAVMPVNKKDILTLLSATEEMFSKYADRPFITMSMSGEGVISRIAGEIFGSAVTFGAIGKTSAPGQLEVSELKEILQIIHKSR